MGALVGFLRRGARLARRGGPAHRHPPAAVPRGDEPAARSVASPRCIFRRPPGPRENLLAEGIDPGSIVVTGNTGIDALLLAVELRNGDRATRRWRRSPRATGRCSWSTTHRRENWGEGIRRVAGALRDLLDAFPELRAVHAAHPNPARARRCRGRARRASARPHPRARRLRRLRPTAVAGDDHHQRQRAASRRRPLRCGFRCWSRARRLSASRASPRAFPCSSAPTATLIVREAGRLLTDAAAREAMTGLGNPYGDGAAAGRIVAMLQQVGRGDPCQAGRAREFAAP